MKERILELFADGEHLTAIQVAEKLGPQFKPNGAAARYFAASFAGVVRAGAIVEVSRGVYRKKEEDINTQINLF